MCQKQTELFPLLHWNECTFSIFVELNFMSVSYVVFSRIYSLQRYYHWDLKFICHPVKKSHIKYTRNNHTILHWIATFFFSLPEFHYSFWAWKIMIKTKTYCEQAYCSYSIVNPVCICVCVCKIVSIFSLCVWQFSIFFCIHRWGFRIQHAIAWIEEKKCHSAA